MTDQAVEAAIAEVNSRFSDWEPTPDMLGYARAVAAALTTPPPADHTDLIARAVREIRSGIAMGAAIESQDNIYRIASDLLKVVKTHASPRELRLEAACRRVAARYDESYSPMCVERSLGDMCRTALELG